MKTNFASELLGGGTDQLIDEVAKQAVNDMIECSVDMWNDSPAGERPDGPPDAKHIRGMASDFAADMLNDFRAEVVARINRMKFDVAFDVETKLKVTNKKFD